jgi:uncharacterized phage-associated protein
MAIKFRVNARKALEVILWFADKRPGIDFHAVLKLLFFADALHLNQWGRPIVGDLYEAGMYGPVALTTYDILKLDPLALELLNMPELPFNVTERYHIKGHRPPDLNKLSESDLEALESTWDKYSNLDFNGLTRESHKHPAYRRAEKEGRKYMNYADFLDAENVSPEVLADLEESAHRMHI